MATTKICGLPVFEGLIADGNCGMSCISLVDYPAVEKDFLAFDKDKQVIKFAVEDTEKRIVAGVVMRANYPIYRSDSNGEYWIMFTPNTIRTMAEKYLNDGMQNQFSCQHDGNPVEGVKMVQWYIKDTAKGINPVGFEEIEDGSLFGEFKVENDEVWNRIKDGELKGFSVEVMMEIQPVEQVVSTEKIPTEYLNWLANFAIKSKISMSKIKETLSKLIGAFGSVTTSGGVLSWDGDEPLAVGSEVFVTDEEGNRTPATDGEYKTEDNKIIVVADGKVSEINDAEPAEPAEPEDEFSKFQRKCANFALSYDERLNKIYDALRSVLADFYIYDAGDDFAVVEYWNGDTYAMRKYELSWNGEEVVIGNFVDGKLGFIPNETAPVTEPAPAPATEPTDYSAIVDAINSLREDFEKFKTQPKGQSAHESFKTEPAEIKSCGNEKYDAFAKRMQSLRG